MSITSDFSGCSFAVAASEIIRIKLMESTPAKVLTLKLWEPARQANRARAVAAFNVSVSFEWGPLPWSGDVLLVDSRGYAVEWAWPAVGRWLVKSLSGAPCVVNIQIQNGAHIPVKWTESRVATSVERVAVLSSLDIVAAADSKIASVIGWAQSDRRSAVLNAGWGMLQAAAVLRVVQGVQGGADWVDADVIASPAGDPTGTADAVALVFGAPAVGVFVDDADFDYYKFTVDQIANLNITFAGDGATPAGNCSFSIIDPNGVEGSFVNEWPFYLGWFTFTPAALGDHYLVCHQMPGSGMVDRGYSVKVELQT